MEEFCDAVVMVALARGAVYGMLRLEAFNDGAAVYWSVFWTEEDGDARSGRMATHQLQHLLNLWRRGKEASTVL